MSPAPARTHEETARAWVAHLRSGGTTTWDAWRERGSAGPAGSVGEPLVLVGGHLPGAQQLELLRRTTIAAGRRVPDELADRVLRASPFGRGLPDLPLQGGPGAPFGPVPADPTSFGPFELLRYATLLLADRLAERAASADEDPAPAPPARVRLLRRRYRLVGDPWAAPLLRDALTRRGLPPGGRTPQVLVLAGPLEAMLAATWTHRVLTGTPAPWPAWVAEVHARRRHALPPGADTVAAARGWAERVGTRRVSVVTSPEALVRLLVPRRVGRRDPIDVPAPLPADAVELARQVRAALEVVCAPGARTRLLTDQLVPLLRALPPGVGQPLGVPGAHRQWVRRRSERLRRGLLSDGYAVAGQPDDLLVRDGVPTGALPDPDGVLRVACEVLVADAEGGQVR